MREAYELPKILFDYFFNTLVNAECQVKLEHLLAQQKMCFKNYCCKFNEIYC